MAIDGNPSGRELPQYKCHKIVRAAKIISISHPSESLHGTLELEGFGPIKLVSGWMEKHQPHVGGYFVAYEAGYTSFSPADAFERGYTRIHVPTFATAPAPAGEKAIEAEIQAKGLNAPRITPADIDDLIVGEQYHVFPGTQTTVCCLTLRSGFTVTGESACASPENFDVGLGRKIAFEHARDKIWQLEGYRLKCKLGEGHE